MPLSATDPNTLVVRHLGLKPYNRVWRAMRDFTDKRGSDANDELWVVNHPPVFTLGQAGKEEHLIAPGEIPVVQSDRGGQVTYHGPGQLVIYLLLNLRRLKIGVRDLVNLVENSIVQLLASYDIEAAAKPDAPGVYVNDAKIASLGLRVRKGCSYHGLSFNLNMDLEPFNRINVCGYQGLSVVQLADLLPQCPDEKEVTAELVDCLAQQLGYTGRIVNQWVVEPTE